MMITIEIDEEQARLLESFVDWARTENFRDVIPSRDVDTAWEMRQAITKISSAIQDAKRNSYD